MDRRRRGRIAIAVDAVGEGSALADRLDQAYPGVERFKAGATAEADEEYADCCVEALGLLGEFLGAQGAVGHRRLREELLAAARTVEYEERYLDSRGNEGATIVEASSKEAVKDSLGRSPDHLDAAAMAVWARDASGGMDVEDIWVMEHG